MSLKSAIEWTNSTWNPVTGCTKVSAGCDHCYAERFSERFRGVKGHPFEPLPGPIDDVGPEGVHWVIVGGESGPGVGGAIASCRGTVPRSGTTDLHI